MCDWGVGFYVLSQEFLKSILDRMSGLAVVSPLLFHVDVSEATESNRPIGKLLPVFITVSHVVAVFEFDIMCRCCSKHLKTSSAHFSLKLR